jgi:hypothetical protein
MMDLVALLSLRDWETAAVFVHENRELVEKGGVEGGVFICLRKEATWGPSNGSSTTERIRTRVGRIGTPR